MSDSDSDWDSDPDEAQLEPPVLVTAASASAAAPAAAAPASSASASSASGPPSVLFALPIQLALKDHPALAAGIPAGITLLYEPVKNIVTLLCYDAHKRPMIAEPLDGAKMIAASTKGSANLPFTFTLGDGETGGTGALGSATLTDSQSRKWTVTFGGPNDAVKFAAVLGVVVAMAKATTAANISNVFLKHDLFKGAGKSLKAKSFVSLSLRGWIVALSTDSSLRGLAALQRVTASTTLTSFNPSMTAAGAVAPVSTPVIDTVVSDVEVDEDGSASAAPSSLGDALTAGKLKTEGGSRLLILPCGSAFARELLAAHAAPTFAPEASFLVLQLTPQSTSKKREKKKEEKKKAADKSKSPVAAAEEDSDSEPAASSSPAAAAASPSSSSSSAAAAGSLFPTWSRSVSSSVSASFAALQSMNEQVGAVPGVQQKLVKFIVNQLYEGLLDDLGLRATMEAQAAASDEAPAAVDATQAAHLEAVQTRIRGLVGSYVEQNSVERKGTLAALVSAWKTSMIPAIQPLVSPEPEGLLAAPTIAALAAEAAAAASSSSSSASSASSAEVAELKAKLKAALAAQKDAARRAEESAAAARDAAEKHRKAFESLEKKHTSLVMTHVDTEDALAKLRSDRDELKKRAEMCTVFEGAVTDMRSMLEKEIEAKQEISRAWEDLSRFQAGYKLTWLPDKSATHCMACQTKFAMFGSSSKGHCRYCGRLFCKKCCTFCAIPEFGYSAKVKICKPCFAFRSKIQGEKAKEDAEDAEAEADGAAGGDSDDDEPAPMAKGGAKAGAKSPSAKGAAASSGGAGGKGGKPQQTLSYDSDELEGGFV